MCLAVRRHRGTRTMIVVLDSRRPAAVGLDVTLQLESFLGKLVAMR